MRYLLTGTTGLLANEVWRATPVVAIAAVGDLEEAVAIINAGAPY